MLRLKEYQERSLGALQGYLRRCLELEELRSRRGVNIVPAKIAFEEITQNTFGESIPYRSVAEMPGMPYVCLRVPTGGGKTLIASHAVGLLRDFIQADAPLILWLVPSNAIQAQTLGALKDRSHPYRQALEAQVGPVMVLDIKEALYVTPATLQASTTVIVSTMQAFRVDDTEGRKVYEQSGALQAHFAGLPGEATADLEHFENGPVKESLANVLRLHRPAVIVDEAHNARTDLSFRTLARFKPSCIIEFTATPNTTDSPSNVLHSVSAAELHADEMIKLPIRLTVRTNWKEVLSDAIATRNGLEAAAKDERRATGEYIRPIVLLQAEPKRKGQETVTTDVLRQTLINDHRIPDEQCAVATGSERELEGVDLFDPDCKIRYVITVQALREGWDCPFAYVLCSVAEMRSSTAIEQL